MLKPRNSVNQKLRVIILIQLATLILGFSVRADPQTLEDLSQAMVKALNETDAGAFEKLFINNSEIEELFGDNNIISTGVMHHLRNDVGFDPNWFAKRSKQWRESPLSHTETIVLHDNGKTAQFWLGCFQEDGTSFFIEAGAYKSNRGWVLLRYI